MNREQKQSETSTTMKNEDVEFAIEQADHEDLEALKRAEAADQRQESTGKE